ncbi:MAG: efflux transporter periplasmic adaptor subunit [Flavobacteriales bacterium]|nr:efflux transporter periplasmic adaptor subunit [Flavobacteriales bacterium]|tara:strand:- start:515 stop:1738 length:1224 start_codon:yes stop_codon:yes gene_type:complete
MKKKLILVIVIILLIGIVYKSSEYYNKKNRIYVKTQKVKLDSITESVSASGKIQPEIEVNISPDVSGEIILLNVKDGQNVNQGDLLLKINPEIYNANLKNIRANLNNIKSNLAQQITQMNDAIVKYDRNVKLHKKKAISTVELETSLNNLELAKLRVKASEYSVESAEASLSEAEKNLQRTSIYSPLKGTISKLNVERGERVVGTAQMTGTEILTIANLNNMEVVVDVSENDIIRVKLNDPVDIKVDAYYKYTFRGSVSEIANSANLIGTSADQVTNFQVKIKILKSSYSNLVSSNTYPFRPGMTASVEINTEFRSNIKTIPLQAVTTRKREIFDIENNTENEFKTIECVFKYDKSLAKIIKVETGIQNNELIEIISGLEIDDEVIIEPYNAISKILKNDIKVYIEK